jgi:tRNA uridine 5-carbamoylmethylation protein Kti12
MEFLLTYAWAIMGVLVVMGALFYFTGFYAKMFPSACNMEAPYVCTEFKVSSDGTVKLAIQNAAGWDQENVNITIQCNRDPAQQRSYVTPLVRTVEKINGSFVQFNCPLLGARFKADIAVNYKGAGETVSHISSGELVTAVES